LHCHLAKFVLPYTWADLSFIAVAKGPGSFTGTRIGVVTARTLAQQFELPLFAFSTLAILAWSQVLAGVTRETVIAVEIPGRSGEVFAGIYQASQTGLVGLFPDTVLSVQEWQQVLKNWSMDYHRVQGSNSFSADVACQALLDLAYQSWQQGNRPDWSDALPFYN